MVDTIGSISYFILTLKTEIMLTDPTFQELLMALATFVIGWFLKRPQDIIKKHRD
jgi:hypothetical protein